MNTYDVIIVGGGIAGLATAEIFARSGHNVCLIEKNKYICQEASGIHHEWFHFGSLYSIFPNSQFLRTMVGGIDDLLHYYRDFEGMNLRVTGDGKLQSVFNQHSWLRPDIIKYIVTKTSDDDFKPKGSVKFQQKISTLFFKYTWDKAVKQFVSRHNRFNNYDWRRGEASHNIASVGWGDYSEKYIKKFVNKENLGMNSESHILLDGFDRPMNASNIIGDLLKSFISYGGVLKMNSKVESYEKGKKYKVVCFENGTHLNCNTLIMACAGGIDEISPMIKVKTVVSPLLVAYPNVYSENIVRMTPFINKTINHIRHEINGKQYSLIGSGYDANPVNKDEVLSVKKAFVSHAENVFPKLSECVLKQVYFGKKTEIVNVKTKRNYLYHIKEMDKGVYLVIPGKFSLAFSLAVNTYKKIIGHYPNTFVTYDHTKDISKFMSIVGHRKIISECNYE
jgi:hypothetical protein